MEKNWQHVYPVGKRALKVKYAAKIGESYTEVIVHRLRQFYVGQKIKFYETSDLKEANLYGIKVPWKIGLIRKIESSRLHIELV